MESSPPAIEELLNTATIESQKVKGRVGSRGQEWYALVGTLVLSDILMIGLAFRLAYWFRFELSIPFFETQALASKIYYEMLVLFLMPLWVIIFTGLGLYTQRILLGGTEEYARVFRGTMLGLLLIMAADFLDPAFIIARGWVLLAWFLTFLMVASGRFVIRRIAYELRRRGYFLSRALIVGSNTEALLLADQLLGWTTSGLEILGFISDEEEVGVGLHPSLKVVGSLEDLEQVISECEVKEVILAGGALPPEKELDIFRKFGLSDQLNLRLSLGLYGIITTGISVKEFAYVPLVEVNKVRLAGIDRVLKTGLDYVFTIPLLILLAPVLLLIGLLVKFDSPGPMIHRRRVMGLNGRQFNAYKFRTMHVNGDEIIQKHPDLLKSLAQDFKIRHDPRITRIGELLRRFSLDELPQLFNVLKRDMSVVGPRMISPEEIDKYSKWDINLLTVRPGITGLWQVSGRSDVSYEERVRLDMHYIRNWTIWLDIQMIVQTIPAVLSGIGAY